MHTKDAKTISGLRSWAESPVAEMFPYALTLEVVRRRGKHFTEPEVMEALHQARHSAVENRLGDAWLTRFLDVVLDKHDRTYNYLSYIALPLLEHARRVATAAVDQRLMQYVHDSTTCSLVGDVVRFELNALTGGDSYLTEQRPPAELIERRLERALCNLAPALHRLGFEDHGESLPLVRRAERTMQFCSAQPLAFTQFTLDASMLPVYVSHDEYMFIRILQTLDLTFSSVSSLLQCGLNVFDRDLPHAAKVIEAADLMLQEGTKHFAILTTMQRECFHTFRAFTTGASAIQSVSYKRMQSLCRTPDKDRLESIAYGSVPSLQQKLKRGNVSLDDKLTALRRAGRTPAAAITIETAMRGISATMTRWAHSHYGIAKKYLGQATGTGYTEGVPYLKVVRSLPVFDSVSPATRSSIGTPT